MFEGRHYFAYLKYKVDNVEDKFYFHDFLARINRENRI